MTRNHIMDLGTQWVLILIVTSMLFGCAPVTAPPLDEVGQIYALGPGQTALGVVKARTFQPETWLWTKGNLEVAAWKVGDYIGWACYGCNVKTATDLAKQLTEGKGNIASGATFSEISNFMNKDGWTKVGPPAGVAARIWSQAAYMQAYMQFMAQSLVSFIILPVGPIPDYLLEEGPQS